MFSVYKLRRLPFSPKEMDMLRAVWLPTPIMASLRTGEGLDTCPDELIKNADKGGQYLSPEYLDGICTSKLEASVARQRLITAYAQLDEDALAQVFAQAFLKAPAESMLGGIATSIAARELSFRLASVDQIMARYIGDLAGRQQLAVAGCLRVIHQEDVMFELLSSPVGEAALNKAINGECQVLLALPQVQRYFHARWYGKRSSQEVEDDMKELFTIRGMLEQPFFLFMLPLVAIYPPLENWQPPWIRTSRPNVPAKRYVLYELLNLVYTTLLSVVDLNTYRGEASGVRDVGLLVWTLMAIVGHTRLINFVGVKPYFDDVHNPFDLISMILSFGGLVLNVCTENLLKGASMMPPICTSNSIVPLAGRELLSLAVLMNWIKLTRLLRLHNKFGPLMLMVMRMIVDLFTWLIIAIIPILAFTFALHTLYRDPYSYENHAGEDDDCAFMVPDTTFESSGEGFVFLIEAMLSADGKYRCFRESSQPIWGTGYMMLFTLFTVIMLVNMLIALMSKTFDNVFEKQEMHFLYLKVRTIDCWMRYTDMPPPLNALSAPYALLLYLHALCGHMRSSKTAGDLVHALDLEERSSAYDLAEKKQKPHRLPPEFMREFGDSPASALAEQIIEFMSEHGDEIVREDRWKTEVLQAIHSKMRPLEDVQEDVKSLNETVEAMQEQLRAIAKMLALQAAGSSIDSSKLLRQVGFSSADGADGPAHSAAQRRRKAAAATSRLNFRLPGSNRPSAKLEKKMTLKDAVLSAGRMKLAMLEEQGVGAPSAEAPRAAAEASMVACSSRAGHVEGSKVTFAACGAADAAGHAAHPAKAPAPAASRVGVRVAPVPAPTSPTVLLDDGYVQHAEPPCQPGVHAQRGKASTVEQQQAAATLATAAAVAAAAEPVSGGGERPQMGASDAQGSVGGGAANVDAQTAAGHTALPGSMPDRRSSGACATTTDAAPSATAPAPPQAAAAASVDGSLLAREYAKLRVGDGPPRSAAQREAEEAEAEARAACEQACGVRAYPSATGARSGRACNGGGGTHGAVGAVAVHSTGAGAAGAAAFSRADTTRSLASRKAEDRRIAAAINRRVVDESSQRGAPREGAKPEAPNIFSALGDMLLHVSGAKGDEAAPRGARPIEHKGP